MREAPEEIKRTIEKHAEELETIARKIHENPELGFEEHQACAWQVRLLREWGWEVQTPFAGLDTAYKAVYGEGSPVFCYMSEYDALPEIGHACGHNLICAAALGAGRALSIALEREKAPGQVVVMGTPAEESKGGKVFIVRNGGLEGIDAVLMAHPSSRTTPDLGSTAIQRLDVTFKGVSAHAAGAPEYGKNALDAVMLLFQGVNAWRQQLPESSRIHGIVVEGGVAPNIIPDLGICTFFLRSPEDDVLAEMVTRFQNVVKGAALMTDTEPEIETSPVPYKARRPNQSLNQAYLQEAKRLGLDPITPDRPSRGSSDFGDVSHMVPGAHVSFGISKESIAGHSIAFREAAGSEYGRRQMLLAAEALARVGHRYLTDIPFRKNVHDSFRAQTGKQRAERRQTDRGEFLQWCGQRAASTEIDGSVNRSSTGSASPSISQRSRVSSQ